MSLLIADISNCHLGSMKLAKEMIRIANEAGADLIKGQVFKSKYLTSLSMPEKFFRQCQLAEAEYIELIDYARFIKNDLFFSVFSHGFEKLKRYQNWMSFPADHTEDGMYHPKVHDSYYSVVGFKKSMIHAKKAPRIKRAWPLYSMEILPRDPALDFLEYLRDQTGSQVGLIDRSIGVDACIKSITWHNVNAIEKTFTLTKEISWDGSTYVDSVFAANSKELEVIANALHG